MSNLAVGLRKFRFGRTIALGDLCLALSEADAESYRKLFPGSAHKIRAVCNAYVTPEMIATGQGRKDTAFASPARLLAVGRLSFQKDYRNLLEALAQLRDRDWILTILGDGPLMDETRQLAGTLGIAERITFAGFVSDAVPHYARSDLLLLPSRWEGFAAVPLEAMAAGCGVAATDNSAGLTRLLRESGITTVPVENSGAFASAIAAALDNGKISDLRSVGARYSLENSVTDHLQKLEQIEEQT